jgi:hypothetical protein
MHLEPESGKNDSGSGASKNGLDTGSRIRNTGLEQVRNFKIFAAPGSQKRGLDHKAEN